MTGIEKKGKKNVIKSKAKITSDFYALAAETSKLNGGYTWNSNFTPTICLCDSFCNKVVAVSKKASK